MLSATGLDLEVEDFHHDTGFLVEQNDVAPDQYVGAVRRWRRQHNARSLWGRVEFASAILGEAFRVALAAFPIQTVSDLSLQVRAAEAPGFFWLSPVIPWLACFITLLVSSYYLHGLLFPSDVALATPAPASAPEISA
jgi:hypothetical protein